MATSEIEKLERRYAENPHGLTFAPLAEVHRKNGDVARALELLTAGLELHPNYIPASIVLGRCHQDLGDLPAAEAAFAHVLRLDDENVIALKSLADINERLEHHGEAENWLRRLISVDRSNDEAREQLRRLEARKKDVEAAAAPAVASAPALEMLDLGSEPAAESPTSAIAESEASPPDPASPEPLPIDLAALEPSRANAENTAAPEAEVAESAAPASALLDRSSESEAAAASQAEEPAPTDEPVQPVAGLISAEFEPPLEAIGGLGVETSEEVVLDASGNSEFRVPDASEDFKALAERASKPRPEPKPIAEPEPVAGPGTGIVKSPTEEEQLIGAPSAPRSYLARDTQGRSVASFFQSLLAARPPADGGTTGAPRNAGAPDTLPTPSGPAPDQKADGAVSFDDFFGSGREESTPVRQRAEAGKDDLDQFQTWLQNLKR